MYIYIYVYIYVYISIYIYMSIYIYICSMSTDFIYNNYHRDTWQKTHGIIARQLERWMAMGRWRSGELGRAWGAEGLAAAEGGGKIPWIHRGIWFGLIWYLVYDLGKNLSSI